MPNHCSYCHKQGHNITRCDSPNIAIHYNQIKIYFMDNLRAQISDEELSKHMFIFTICRKYNLFTLKAVSSRYTKLSITGTSKTLIAERFWEQFQNECLENVTGELELLDLDFSEPTHLPTTADVIPSYAQDILQEQEEEEQEQEQDISWFIDRTPNQTEDNTTSPLLESNVFRGSLDLFIPFTPRNLNDDFDSVVNYMAELETQIERETEREREGETERETERETEGETEREKEIKKYNITPILSIIETSDILEQCHDCSICYENTKLSDTVSLNCGHQFCGGCVKGTLNYHNNMYAGPACALCRAPMTNLITTSADIYNLVSENCY